MPTFISQSKSTSLRIIILFSCLNLILFFWFHMPGKQMNLYLNEQPFDLCPKYSVDEKKSNQQQQKKGQTLNQDFSKEDTWIAKKHMERCSMSKIKTKHTECWPACGTSGTLILCWGKCKMVQSPWKIIWQFLKWLSVYHSPQPTHSTPGCLP